MSRRTNFHYDEVDDDDEDVTQLRSKVKLLKEVSITSSPRLDIIRIEILSN